MSVTLENEIKNLYGFSLADLERRGALIGSLGASLIRPDNLRAPEYVGRWTVRGGCSSTFFVHRVGAQPVPWVSGSGFEGLSGVALDSLGISVIKGTLSDERIHFIRTCVGSAECSPQPVQYHGSQSNGALRGKFRDISPGNSVSEPQEGLFYLLPFESNPDKEKVHRLFADVHLRPFTKQDVTLSELIRVSHLYKPEMSEETIEQHFANAWSEQYHNYAQPMDMVKRIVRSDWNIPTEFTKDILLEGAPLTSAQEDVYNLRSRRTGAKVTRTAPGVYMVELPPSK